MSIVLKENEWAEHMINEKSLGKKPSETMKRVARYYLDNGCSKAEARKRLDAFLISCDPLASLPKWSRSLDYALSRATKYDAINIDSISISHEEMSVVDSLDGVQIKRLAFTLLCLAKYWNIVNPELDSWVVNKDNEIMKMANINTSLKRQSLMYFKLNEAGLIQFSKKVDNTNIRVNYVKDGDAAMEITDFRNLGYQYLMYHDGPYFVCSVCGVVTKAKSNTVGKQIYCSECASKMQMKQAVNHIMRSRYKNLDNPDMNKPVYTVYMHKTPDEKMYIGVTSSTLYKRWANGNGYSGNKTFFDDIEKYGWDSIDHYIIAVVQDENVAIDIEEYYINKFKTYDKDNGFNRKLRSYNRRSSVDLQEYISERRVDGRGHIIKKE